MSIWQSTLLLQLLRGVPCSVAQMFDHDSTVHNLCGTCNTFESPQNLKIVCVR